MEQKFNHCKCDLIKYDILAAVKENIKNMNQNIMISLLLSKIHDINSSVTDNKLENSNA